MIGVAVMSMGVRCVNFSHDYLFVAGVVYFSLV